MDTKQLRKELLTGLAEDLQDKPERLAAVKKLAAEADGWDVMALAVLPESPPPPEKYVQLKFFT